VKGRFDGRFFVPSSALHPSSHLRLLLGARVASIKAMDYGRSWSWSSDRCEQIALLLLSVAGRW